MKGVGRAQRAAKEADGASRLLAIIFLAGTNPAGAPTILGRLGDAVLR